MTAENSYHETLVSLFLRALANVHEPNAVIVVSVLVA